VSGAAQVPEKTGVSGVPGGAGSSDIGRAGGGTACPGGTSGGKKVRKRKGREWVPMGNGMKYMPGTDVPPPPEGWTDTELEPEPEGLFDGWDHGRPEYDVLQGRRTGPYGEPFVDFGDLGLREAELPQDDGFGVSMFDHEESGDDGDGSQAAGGDGRVKEDDAGGAVAAGGTGVMDAGCGCGDGRGANSGDGRGGNGQDGMDGGNGGEVGGGTGGISGSDGGDMPQFGDGAGLAICGDGEVWTDDLESFEDSGAAGGGGVRHEVSPVSHQNDNAVVRHIRNDIEKKLRRG
jgi:hypothetical protein